MLLLASRWFGPGVGRVSHTMLVSLTMLALPLMAAEASAQFQISPASVQLEGNLARAQLTVAAALADGTVNSERSADMTHVATYASSDPAIVTVDDTGRLLAVGNGTAQVAVTVNGVAQNIAVQVSAIESKPVIGFTEQILPILTKAGCNAGACHASQHGKGGFKLSVYSYAPDEDFTNITRDRNGRRFNSLEPAKSLFLLKPTLAVPHGGNRRLTAGSVEHQTLVAWLSGTLVPPAATDPKVASIQVLPNRRVGGVGLTQQLRVLATYSNGKTRDVTALAKFDTMDESVLSVTAEGKLQTVGRGQAPVMARFEGQAEICTVVVPYAEQVELAGWTENNFIDTLAAAKFRELGISPSALCDDPTFLRRAYLDATGTLPTVEQATAFLDSADPEKRKKLIDQLLGLTGDPALDVHNNDYSAYWALKWSDLLRSNSATIGEQGMWALHNWLKGSLRDNKPYDVWVRELITAKGSIYMNGPANYFRIANNPPDMTETTAQLFLGVRMQCAKCHHHPFEKYSQEDYYSLAAFFSRVGLKNSLEFGLFGSEQVVLVRSGGEVAHPRSGQVMAPKPLDADPVPETFDRRQALATWLTQPDNKFFARAVVNRYLGYLLGRGLVEPVDDLRATNPPTNVALMDALADDFVKSGFNLKHLLRTIMNSRLYQLDSQPTESNASDTRFYSYYKVKRMAAEPLLDAIDQATGTRTKYRNMPLGSKAIELPDANYPDYFLTTFGKPRRASVCECERSPHENLAQALHTLNGDIVAGKVSDNAGRVAQRITAGKTGDELVTELYLATLSRRPSAEELAAAARFLQENPDPRTCYEDLLWSLLNSKQFLFIK